MKKTISITPHTPTLFDFDRELIASLPASGPRYTSYPTADYLAAAPNTQVLIFHGTHDTLIPAVHGQRLAQTWGARAQYHELPAGHNDMFSQAALWHMLENALP